MGISILAWPIWKCPCINLYILLWHKSKPLKYRVSYLKDIMSLSLVIFLKFFFFRVESLSLPSKHEYKTCIFVWIFWVCSLFASISNYTSPNFRITCSIALMFTLQHEFELSMLPSIQYNGHVGGLC